MTILKVVSTLLLIAVLLLAMKKKFYTITSIMGIGVVALLIFTAVTGKSILGDGTSGSKYLDVFEFVSSSFISAFKNPGLLIVVLVGFSAYMKEIKASEMLVTLACTPLRKIKSPYVICSIAFLIGAVVKLAITSPSGFSALMMITMFPILVSCGVNPVTAAATVALSQGTDWGPGDMGSGIILPISAEGTTVIDYFTNVNLISVLPAIIVMAVVAPIVYRYFDKKESGALKEAAPVEVRSYKEIGVPVFYAFLPLMPVIFVLLFSKIGIGTVIMTTEGVTILSLFIAIFIELIRKPKKFTETINNTAAYFKSMGSAFASVVVLVAAASVFAKAISSIGGFGILTDLVADTGFPAPLLLALIGVFACLVVVISSSFNTAAYTFAPSVASIASSYGLSASACTLPMQFAQGFGRILCPINASHLLIATTADVNIVDLIKRNVIPAAAAYITAIVVWMLFVL